MYPRKDERSGLYGYWGRDQWAMPPQFQYAHQFVNGYAAVDLGDGRPALLALDGKAISLAEICGGKRGIRQPKRTCVGFGDYEPVPPRYAVVCSAQGRKREWGLIDATSLNYIALTGDLFARAKTVRACGEYLVLIYPTSRPVEWDHGLFNLREMRLELPAIYACIYPSTEAIWVVARRDDAGSGGHRYAFYDLSKQQLLPGWYTFALPFSCGFGAIRVGDWDESGRSFFVDRDLQPVFDAEFEDVGPFSHGLAAVYDEDAGYIDTTGRRCLVLPYETLKPFNQYGLALANRDEAEWDIDIIDTEGQSRRGGFNTADFSDGNFPYFEVSKAGEDRLFDINLNRIY